MLSPANDCQPLGEFGGAALLHEEIHVVKFEAVDLPVVVHVLDDAGDALGAFRQPAAVRQRDDRAEIAGERAAERRVVIEHARAEVVGAPDVAAHVDAVVGEPGQLVHGDVGRAVVDADFAVLCAVAKRGNVGQRAAVVQPIHERAERRFALSLNDVIDTAIFEDDFGVLGREVAAPQDRQVGQRGFDLLADRDGLPKLRTGHDRDGEQLRAGRFGAGDDLGGGVGDQVAVDELDVVVGGDHGGDRQQRQRQALFPRRGADRVIEQDRMDASFNLGSNETHIWI